MPKASNGSEIATRRSTPRTMWLGVVSGCKCMPCETPRRAYPSGAGGRVKFYKPTDYYYNMEPYTGLTVPCGTCILCRIEQARQWAVRITHEATQHTANSFITLTYSDPNIPPHGSLRYQDLVKFWKRLRYHYGRLSYYAVGEYGETSMRPHYHACIFGHDFTEGAITKAETPHRLWTNLKLEAAWQLGAVTVGQLTHETALYTSQYVLKKQRSKQRYVYIDETTGELIQTQAPRSFMSKNIAQRWWSKWNQGVEDWDHVVINARPQKPPRAYDKWLGANKPEKLEEIKEERIQKMKEKTKTKEQTRAHAENARARERQRVKSV